MNEHHHPDINGQIDALTGDSASWTAPGGTTRPQGTEPRVGVIAALELPTVGQYVPIDISGDNPARDIARKVGDPGVDRILHLRRVQFWIGDNSKNTHPLNLLASLFLRHLLADVRDGHYIASDHERDHARALLDVPDRHSLPAIHGPCVVTGVGDGGRAAALDENFESWFTTLLNDVAQVQQSAVVALAREIGIAPGQVGHVTLVPPR